MLLNDFFTYKLKEKNDEKIVAEVEFNTEHNIYKGHFPGMPVTPGICQVQMVQEILNDVISKNYRLKSARDIKFLNFIDPLKISSLQLTITLSPKSDGALSVNALISGDDVNYLKIRSVFITD